MNRNGVPILRACGQGKYCRVTNVTTFEGECETDIANTCNGENNFFCSSPGIYPNPSDCTSFYKCSKNAADTGLDVELIRCFTGNVFSPLVSGYCAPRIGNLNCFTLSCPTTGREQLIKFGNTLRYYGICSPASADPIMKVCPKGSIFKPTGDKVCEFICPGFGNFPNSENRKKFYNCIIVPGVGYRATERKCGALEVYNLSTRNCQMN